MLACRAGAARVHAIEKTALAVVARDIVRANGFLEEIDVVRGDSAEVFLPDRADVVVCDQLGPFGIDGGILKVARHARERLLRPGGQLVPHAVELVIALVQQQNLHERLAFWHRRPAGFDFSPAGLLAANTPARVRLRAQSLLSHPQSAALIELTRDADLPLRLHADIRVTTAGVLHGVAGWFVARLSTTVSMTNSPIARGRIRRRQMVFPIAEAIDVAAGETVRVALRARPEEGIYAWTVDVAGRQFRQSTVLGVPLAREDLLRTHPEYRPVCTAKGRARLTVLRLCDGQHTLAEIERAVGEEHRHLFMTPEDVSTFVAGVLAQD